VHACALTTPQGSTVPAMDLGPATARPGRQPRCTAQQATGGANSGSAAGAPMDRTHSAEAPAAGAGEADVSPLLNPGMPLDRSRARGTTHGACSSSSLGVQRPYGGLVDSQ